MRKPKNRKERVNFILQKCGYDDAVSLVGFTDSELKKYFEKIYPLIKDKSDYKKPNISCMRCGEKVLWHTECGCSFEYDRAVFDEEGWIDDIENCSPDDLTDIAIQKNKEFIKFKNNLK